MSVVDNIESLYNGSRKEGYGFDLINRNLINSADVDLDDPDSFDGKVAELGHHVIDIIEKFRENDLCVQRIKIGKTGVAGRKNREFDPSNYLTWKYGDTKNASPGDRYRGNKADGFNVLIVIHCFTRADVPEQLRNHGIDQQSLVLNYEYAVDKWMRDAENFDDNIEIIGDDGGGGRRGKVLAGGVLYVALVVKEDEEHDKDEETDDEKD